MFFCLFCYSSPIDSAVDAASQSVPPYSSHADDTGIFSGFGCWFPRHSDDDCAPPSYHEVTQLSSSSNTPSCATHDGQDELPPTYEETMGSSIYSPHPLLPSFLHSQQENSGCMPSSSPSVTMVCGEAERCGTGFASMRVCERDAGQGHTSASVGGLFSSYTHKPLPLMIPTLPSLQLDTGAGLGRGVPAPSQHASVRPMMQQHSQHSLALPPQHMSAPASPRQLSAPPSPHPFSAPPSPRQLSPHQHPNMPLQYVSASGSPQRLSAPLSLHMLSAQPPSHSPSGPPSPHTFSAPSSPRPLSGQHSWTPPPQYSSTPPSPHQLSTPPSPHMLSSPPSPCFPPGPLPMHPSSTQPQFPTAASLAARPPGPPPSHHFAAPSSISHHRTQPWAPPPPAGSSHEGYTCFTYNFVTPLPVETSPAAPILHGHTSTISYPVRDCAAGSTHPGHTDSVGEGWPGPLVAQSPASQETVYLTHEGRARASLQPEVSLVGVGETSQSQRTFPSRTDIQANI